MNTDKKFIVFLDILGFKDLVKNNTHGVLLDIFKKFLFLNQYKLANGQINQSASSQDELFNTDISKVHLISISDSIVLYSNDDSIDSFINIVNAASTLLNVGLKEGLPLRGGISCGEFSAILKEPINQKFDFSRQLLLGKALIDAYELESLQDWSGCVIQEECISNFTSTEEKAKLNFIINNHIIKKYNVPLKEEHKEFNVVNWINDTSFTEQIIRDAFSKHNKNSNTVSVQSKIQNTIDFFNYINNNQYFSEPQAFLENK